MSIEYLSKELENLERDSLKRSLRVTEGPQDTFIIIDGKKVLNLSGNNYLGLANHPRLKNAAKLSIDKFGTSSSASRLISGNNILYRELENKLSQFKKTESSIVFNSGFMANLGTISALVGKDDHIFSDKLNHASIIDGAILSRAELKRFPHKDLAKLEDLLKNTPFGKRKLIITDTLFSMDGDIAPLKEMHRLAKRFGAIFMVDEAHATGVFGKTGSGLLEELSICDPEIVQMGTFSKALGSLGGYIAGKKDLIDYILNKSRSLIYTTALPPAVLASSIEALEIVKDDSLKKALWENIKFFKAGIKDMGLSIGDSESQIIPIIIGESPLALKFAKGLFDEGIFAQAIRPPTVPQGTSRVRISLMTTHRKEDLESALEKIRKVSKLLGVI